MAEKLPKLSGEFREFLVEAKINGYGSENAAKNRLEGGTYEIVFEEDGWRYADNYIGGNPYVGYENVAVEHDGQWLPVWGMSYRGKLLGTELDGETLGGLLGDFLSKPDSEMPIRGPLNAWDDAKNFRYRLTHACLSSLEDFEAGEQIFKSSDNGHRVVYSARFLGGLANRQTEAELSPQPWLE